MKQHIGLIGPGNMGLAIINGLINSQMAAANQITIFGRHPEQLQTLSQTMGIKAAESEVQAAQDADILFLAVKPYVILPVLEKIKAILSPSTLIISVAAGITIADMETVLGDAHKIIRVMPNTPVFVNEGMCSLTENRNVTADELNIISTMFNSLGSTEVVPESLIHAVVGASGSAPAYVFMFIEAVADAAVLSGMPRAKAYKFAAQAVLGSAKMVLESGKHPGELKDMVCSPGGTTIEAVKIFEEKAFRGAIIDAVTACINKSKQLSGE
ncbi:pyrroline-5-carboxylate reductase [Utexia brackfieldae]|uniref:pyrroline-5-carboxylate reductase n=1 Tax=Utexia brackfieldae TaxID=3074108 RepID=UPI00370D1999